MCAIEDTVWLLLCDLLRVCKQLNFKNLLNGRGRMCPLSWNHRKLHKRAQQTEVSHLH